jgi:cysteine desulfuration protein SufE
VFLRLDSGRRATFRVRLGPHVQTLTRAMTAILCKGLDGCTPETVVAVPQDFVPKIVGGQLVRVRSQTVYYVLGRMKSICQVLLNRERAAAAG